MAFTWVANANGPSPCSIIILERKTFAVTGDRVVFATRGHCIKGKQCQYITIKNQNMSLCSTKPSLISFYALPCGGKSKGAVVHWAYHQ